MHTPGSLPPLQKPRRDPCSADHRGFLALEKSLSEALRASANATPQETTRAAGHAYLTFALKNPGVFRIMFRSDMYDPNSHPELVCASKAARSQLHGLAKLPTGARIHAQKQRFGPTSTASRSSFSTDRPHLGERKRRNTPLCTRVHRLPLLYRWCSWGVRRICAICHPRLL